MLSPAAWLIRLESRMDARWLREMAVYDAYYEGDHRLTFATAKFREAFGSLFGTLADNWCPIVVNSSAERMTVQGFRFGESQQADQDAWDIWQANNLDGAAAELQTEAIKLGEAAWLVEPPESAGAPPKITSEHPSQMIVAHAPGDRRKRLAALKKWKDEDGFAYATLYLPEQILKYRSAGPLSRGGTTGGRINWTTRSDDPGGHNPLGVVPVIPVSNDPSMLRGGQSDLRSVVPLQNAINKLLCDMIIGSEYLGFPMRVLLGVDKMVDETGQPITARQFENSPSRVWTFPSPDSSVAEFNAADLDNFNKAMENLVRHLTAQTRVPPHYMVGQVVNASGDALKAAEVGLTSKVRKKIDGSFGEAHEEMMRVAFLATGDTERAKATDAETIWKDPESRSQAELVDSLVKLSTLGVPREILFEKAGFSPQEIDRMMVMIESESVLQQIPASRESLRITEQLGPGGQPLAPSGVATATAPATQAPVSAG